MRLQACFALLLVLAVPLVSRTVSGDGAPAPPAPPDAVRPSRPASGPLDANGRRGDPVDSARAEMEIGRHWHAARILRDVHEDVLGPEGLLLLARAEAGYLNWGGVRTVLGGAPWLDDVESGRGWRLLARALEEEGAWTDAAAAWETYLASPGGVVDPEREALVARLARVRARMDRMSLALSVVDSLSGAEDPLGSWLALELVSDAAEAGDTSAVRTLRGSMVVPETRRRSWEAMARARLEAGDSAGAEFAYRSALDSLAPGTARGRAWAAIGGLRLRAADTVAAREAYLQALDAAPRAAPAVAAARRLLALGGLDAVRALQAARALDRGGELRPALEAYDLHASLSPAPPSAETRLARARLLSLRSGRHDEAIEEFRALDGQIGDRRLAVRNLSLWMDLRARQGRGGDVATIRGWIVERYPESPEAVEVVFSRGDEAQDRDDLDEALAHYGRLQRMNSSLNRSGLARMRMAQIHLGRGARDDALGVYRSYLEEYPEGRRRDEATYWIGRILMESDDTADASALLRSISERSPLSYYAVQAAALLGEPYRPRFSGEAAPEPRPAWLSRGLRSADLLAVAGLEDGRAATLDDVGTRALESSDGVALTLAGELLERGLTIEAINVGWALRERGVPWSRSLLEIIYPFPYREMVVRAARERGVDPMMVAALIRQESAFDADIVSRAGAVGLMQVMPATGRELAREEGPVDFSVASLEAPEVNLHLGTRFFRDMWDRYGRDLPLVLSAYNAGPTRATRWREFSEVADPLRFTERIPFRETRDYVKQVTRNLALYHVLYGEL